MTAKLQQALPKCFCESGKISLQERYGRSVDDLHAGRATRTQLINFFVGDEKGNVAATFEKLFADSDAGE